MEYLLKFMQLVGAETGGRKKASITSEPFSLLSTSENPRGPYSHLSSLPRPFIPGPPNTHKHVVWLNPLHSYQCREWTSSEVFFPHSQNYSIMSQTSYFQLFFSTAAWLSRCFKLIQIAMWSLWNNYECCLSICGHWGGPQRHSFAEFLLTPTKANCSDRPSMPPTPPSWHVHSWPIGWISGCNLVWLYIIPTS